MLTIKKHGQEYSDPPGEQNAAEKKPPLTKPRTVHYNLDALNVGMMMNRQPEEEVQEGMGLTAWKNAPDGKIVKADVSVAKNCLSMDEMQELNEIVTMYPDYATRQARRHIPMTMADWASKLDAFLQFNDTEILRDEGKVPAAIAKAFADGEFEQYRFLRKSKVRNKMIPNLTVCASHLFFCHCMASDLLDGHEKRNLPGGRFLLDVPGIPMDYIRGSISRTGWPTSVR